MDKNFSTQVNSPARGNWSHPNFLELRRRHVHLFKQELDRLENLWLFNRSREFYGDRMDKHANVYLGSGISDWPASAPNEIVWLQTAPVEGKPIYPVYLDIAESARAIISNEILSLACTAIAPTWEDLEFCKLNQTEESAPRWDDVQGGDDTLANYLIEGLARVIASLGSSFGVILRHPEFYEDGSTRFAVRLLFEAKLTGLHVALEAPIRLALDSRYRSQLQTYRVIEEPYTKYVLDIDDLDIATQLVAVSPQGIPEKVLKALGVSFINSPLMRCDGPTDKWLFLPSTSRCRVLKQLLPRVRRELHAELFDAWQPTFWGYLRRAGHAILAANYNKILGQHTSYSCGIGIVGQEFLYRQFVSLTIGISKGKLDLSNSLYAFIGAAHLAARMRKSIGFHSAIRYYKYALQCTANLGVKADIIYAIANLYASQHNPNALDQAREWYLNGFTVLQSISSVEDKTYIEIRLSNGLALVEYYQGRNLEALRLQEHARSVAVRALKDYPHLNRWAVPILNSNTAKLLIKRFNNFSAAIALLEENINVSEPVIQENARIDLAQLYFDLGYHHKVVEILDVLYGGKFLETFDERLELFGRLMFSVSLIHLGKNCSLQSQMPRLTYLGYVVGKPGTHKFLEAIFRACDT